MHHQELIAMFNTNEGALSDEWEINRSELEMGQKMKGEQYGEVYKGTYLKTGLSVAVRTFKVSKQTNYFC